MAIHTARGVAIGSGLAVKAIAQAKVKGVTINYRVYVQCELHGFVKELF